MGGGWSPFEIIGSIFAVVAGVVGGILTGGVLTGVLVGLGTMMVASTIEGIATGRMFKSFGAFLFEPLRLVCKLLGITDENVTQGFMSASKVFHENQYPDTLVAACIARNKDGTDLPKYYYDFAKVGTAQFDKYYYTGKRRYIDALPDASVASSTFQISTVETAIRQDKGYSVIVENVTIGYPDDFTWVKYMYQERGQYNYETDIINISGKEYRLKSVDFIPSNNTINASLKGVNNNASNTTEVFNAAPTGSYFIAVYRRPTSTTSYMWIHRTTLSDLGVDFTDDDLGKMVKGNINCLPVACLRNNKVDLKDAANNGNVSASFRHPKRYKQTQKLLKGIGLDIEQLTKGYHENGSVNDVYDVYLMAGISPKQTLDDRDRDPEGNPFSVEVTAKYVYKTIEGIYENLPCAVAGQPYFFTFKEPPLKGQIVWAGVPTDEITGKKCKYKHYTMETDGGVLTYRVILQVLTEYLGYEDRYSQGYDNEGNPYTSSLSSRYFRYKAEYVSVDVDSLPVTPAKIYEALDNRTPFFPDRTSSNEVWANQDSIGDSWSDQGVTTGQASEAQPEFPDIAEIPLEWPYNNVNTPPYTGNPPWYRILRAKRTVSYNQDSDTYSSGVTYLYEDLASKPYNTDLEPDDPDYNYQPGYTFGEQPTPEYYTPYEEPASLILYYQHSETAYTRVILRNLVSIYSTDTVDQGLLDTARVTDSKFIFPIAYAGLKSLTVYDKTKLLSEGFYMLFFAKKTQHLEFYETAAFGTFLQIVGVVVTIVVSIFTMGSQTMTVQMAIQALIKMAVVYVGVTLALKIISAVVPDSTMKAVLSAVVLVAAIAIGGGFNDFDFSTAVQLAEVPSKVIDIYTKDQMKFAQQDMADLQSRYKSAKEQIDKATGQTTLGIDTFDVLSAQSITREWGGRLMSVDEYYTLALTCPDLYSVCQDQIDRNKTVDLDVLYPLYDM